MVHKRAHGVHGRALLPATLCGRADKHTRVLAPVRAVLPLAAGLVPEDLPLGREIAVAGGDAKEDGVVSLEGLRVREDLVAGLGGGGVHLQEDLGGQGFLDSGGEE